MCIFCKIINGEIPSKKIYEDEDVLAILDISQATKGHTLVMPKKHYANLLEIDEEVYAKVMKVAKKIAAAEMKAFEAKGVNLLNNCNETAGQTVMHFHVHVIPRYEVTDVDFKFTDHSDSIDLASVQEELVKAL